MKPGVAETIGLVDDHGGSLGRARFMFPHAPQPWIDLSTGINPHSYPLFDLPATAFTRLPEPQRVDELARIAARTYGVPGGDCVVAAPGTQILLPLVMALVRPGKAKVLGPTYAEHARAARIAGHAVEEVADIATLADCDLAVVVNPNNPDGRIAERAHLLDIAARLSRRGGLLVVDEAFMDVGPDGESLAGDVAQPGLVVLRSFGKFYGLAGVRLGFALTEQRLATRLESGLGPWAVSGPALEIGIRALADVEWQAAMRATLFAEAARLDALFGRFGMQAARGTVLFRFLQGADMRPLFETLGNNGILLRGFAWSRAALRCGLPADEAAWARLESALAAWHSHNSEKVA